MSAAGGDRGDNTARGTCFHQAHGIFGAPLICALPAEHLGAHRSDDGAQWTRVPAADRQTDEERRLAWFTDDELAAELARRAAAADNSDGGSDA